MENIKFSILVPVYKVEKYIDKCIQSVINQTYSNWELILVDDGSPDNSGKICDRYANDDERITVVHKENQGLISARRVGIANATGDYYCFLDSDDYIDTELLKILNKKINKYNADCVMFGYDRVCEDRIIFSVTEDETFLTEKRLIYKKCFGNFCYNPLCRKCVKSTVFDGRDYSAYYKFSHTEDLLQSVEIYKNIDNLLIISECLYKYRINPESITRTVKYENYNLDNTIREYVLNFIEKEKVFTNSDKKEYVGYALKIIKDEILTIIHFDTNFKNKKVLLKKLKNEPYFNRLISYGSVLKNIDKKTLIFTTMLRFKMYNILIFVGKLK